MRNIIFLALVLMVAGCNNNSGDGYVTVEINKVEQVGAYTYMLAVGEGKEYWIAASSMLAIPGETYKYKGGLQMENFYSKELDRTFDRVLFLDEIIPGNGSAKRKTKDVTPGSMVTQEKSGVKISRVEGTVSIAEIYANPAAYKGKMVRINGEVTKFNLAIMDRNWVHLQDGTEHDGKYDLTITSSETFEVGTTVIVEGVLAVDIDFGYGYSYEVLLEKATVVK